MTTETGVVIWGPEESDLDKHPYIYERSGLLRHEFHLVDDPDTGVCVKLVRYEKGQPIEVHTHTISHGVYVLKGRLRCEQGIFGPGTFIWWLAGTEMFHGATKDEDCDVLFVTNGPFDIQFAGHTV